MSGDQGHVLTNPVDLSSFNHVERLVQQLYLPGTPQQIVEIQNNLQQLQRSDQGWQLADTLLQSQDEKVRFFGALTFTIKINSDWSVSSPATDGLS